MADAKLENDFFKVVALCARNLKKESVSKAKREAWIKGAFAQATFRDLLSYVMRGGA